MIEKFSIPQIDKNRLQKQVDMGVLYQKHDYSQHCQEHATCSYHCINFALSDSIVKEFQSPCHVQHTERCPERDNILCTLAEIEYHITNVIDSEYRQEFSYDFHNASESIVELFRHVLRGVCQNNEKTKIIKNLSSDSTFAIFDWGQKIIPQRYREPQRDKPNNDSTATLNDLTTTFNHLTTSFNNSTASFNNSAASFNNSTASFNNSTATFNNSTATIADSNYIPTTYIVALTFANQNDLDTVSATQLIIEKFYEDHSHIKYVFKRSDNA
ncbi:unnamed protein product, partial [Rotaria sp. Silwood1]